MTEKTKGLFRRVFTSEGICSIIVIAGVWCLTHVVDSSVLAKAHKNGVGIVLFACVCLFGSLVALLAHHYGDRSPAPTSEKAGNDATTVASDNL